MDDKIKNNNTEETENEKSPKESTDNKTNSKLPADSVVKYNLSGMYQNWFLSYASYVILERAVPNISDGLKPVQRRILHSMKELEDGKYNKVANLVGNTMKYHPHGDSSIGDALTQLGQKDLLIDCQGNWGNILTGDSAAAPRYIEARLSKFAIDVVFNPKTTEWIPSYDGRKLEPKTLPVKFPLLLAQGAEGIAVGLSSKILPHNVNELIDASVLYLKKEPFTLYPDFQTGGLIDVSKYNDGERGGVVKIRSKINKLDNKTLVITEIPYGKTTSTIIDSILKANEKGKIKIKKIDDNTAQNAEILIHLSPGTSSDKTIDALYAFSDCEVSISPNCCVIENNKPRFLSVSDILKYSTDNTLELLRKELNIRRKELNENLMFASLEKIFIKNRIYKKKQFEESKNIDTVIIFIDNELTPYKSSFAREITRDDILKLLEIKMQRILKFNTDKADNYIESLNKEIKEVEYNLAHIVQYTINWFEKIKNKYGNKYPRHTEIRNFDNIEATTVIEANEKLYINREEGFIGTGLKKDEYVCPCSKIDNIIIFYKDGRMVVTKVSEKLFVGKGVLYLNVFKKNDKRTIYNVIYRDGKAGNVYIKRFSVNSITRDKEYEITLGSQNSRILYFSSNPNGEAETVKVILKPSLRMRVKNFDKDFSEIKIKGRQSMGNILTKKAVQKILIKKKGGSTLGGRKIWYDEDIMRLNCDEHGKYLGEFKNGDQILVINREGEFYTTDYDLNIHYEGNIKIIEKYDPNKIWTVILYDADQKNYPYIKRFQIKPGNKPQSYTGENKNSKIILITDTYYPRFEILFGGNDSYREKLIIDADDFIGIKSFKAKGKRITTWTVERISEIEPVKPPQIEEIESNDENEDEDEKENDTQMSLF